jgi:maltooligosyltrehalose trehalohydrolase
MKEMGGGWLEAVVDCGPNDHYRFRLNNVVFPDPASRLQSGGVHGWSVVQSPAARLELMPIAAFPGQRNWGYDGVLPFAPAEAYGSPETLRDLISKAHALGLSVILDVVYNHFGPDGNYLPLYAKRFFREDFKTPWGAGIDFRQPEVRAFFLENACYWLGEFGFDGLRLDAVHAMRSEGWLAELPERLRSAFPDRKIKLVMEDEDNRASLIEEGYDAQWNDDMHHVLHVLLTEERGTYYGDYSEKPAAKLAKALTEGFIYQGEFSPTRGDVRGEPSGHLPPSSFISFLQNHDQTGNRAFGERLVALVPAGKLKAAIAMLLLCPQIPLLFMGEEQGAATPFLYFTDHTPELAQKVREGRKREFAHKAGLAALPDANDVETYLRSRPVGDFGEDWFEYYRSLIALRARYVVPHLNGTRSLGAIELSDRAVLASWRLGNGTRLTLAANFGKEVLKRALPTVTPIFGETQSRERLDGWSTMAWVQE